MSLSVKGTTPGPTFRKPVHPERYSVENRLPWLFHRSKLCHFVSQIRPSIQSNTLCGLWQLHEMDINSFDVEKYTWVYFESAALNDNVGIKSSGAILTVAPSTPFGLIAVAKKVYCSSKIVLYRKKKCFLSISPEKLFSLFVFVLVLLTPI